MVLSQNVEAKLDKKGRQCGSVVKSCNRETVINTIVSEKVKVFWLCHENRGPDGKVGDHW